MGEREREVRSTYLCGFDNLEGVVYSFAERNLRMKVCAGKSMPRVATKSSTMRVATRMAAGKKRASGKATHPQVAAGVAAMTALTASAPALAAVNEVGQVAGAEFLPSVLVPLVGLVFPGVAMASLFIYVTKEQPAK